MLSYRVIPCLLLSGGGLVKTHKFAKPKYVGDPINAVRIFNEKEVDELMVLDIDASKERRGRRARSPMACSTSRVAVRATPSQTRTLASWQT